MATDEPMDGSAGSVSTSAGNYAKYLPHKFGFAEVTKASPQPVRLIQPLSIIGDRRLLTDGYAAFRQIRGENLYASSRRLKLALEDYAHRMQQSAEDGADRVDAEWIAFCFSSWNLFEICFILPHELRKNDPSLEAPMVNLQLLLWLDNHVLPDEELEEDPLSKAFQALMHPHPTAWESILAAIEEAKFTLSSRYSSDAIEDLSSLLDQRKKVIDSMYFVVAGFPSEASKTELQRLISVEFQEEQDNYQQKVSALRARLSGNSDFAGSPLEKMLLVLSGEFNLDMLEDWFESNPWAALSIELQYGKRLLTYRPPEVGDKLRRRLAQLCVPLESLDCGPESQEYLSLAGLHLMHELVSGNPFSLIGELSRFRAFPWVSVHAMELLRCVGVLPQKTLYPSAWGSSPRPTLLCDFASYVASNTPCWRVAFGYAVAAGTLPGLELGRSILAKVNPESDKEAEQILRLCDRHGFSSEAVAVCRVRAQYWLSHSRFGQALQWAFRYRDVACMNKVVKRLVGYALPASAEEMRSRMGQVIEYSSEVRDVVAPFHAPILAACPSLQTVFDLEQLFSASKALLSADGHSQPLRQLAAALYALIGNRSLKEEYWLQALYASGVRTREENKVEIPFTSHQAQSLLSAFETAQLDATRAPGFDPEKKAAIKSWLVERIETAMKKELEAPSSLPNTQG